jgi:hypothetical protein
MLLGRWGSTVRSPSRKDTRTVYLFRSQKRPARPKRVSRVEHEILPHRHTPVKKKKNSPPLSLLLISLTTPGRQTKSLLAVDTMSSSTGKLKSRCGAPIVHPSTCLMTGAEMLVLQQSIKQYLLTSQVSLSLPVRHCNTTVLQLLILIPFESRQGP